MYSGRKHENDIANSRDLDKEDNELVPDFQYMKELSRQPKQPKELQKHEVFKLRFWDRFKQGALAGFVRTYPIDGYNPSTNTLNTDGKKLYYPLKSAINDMTVGLAIASFFALPTRLDANRKYTVKQFRRNVIGGWNDRPQDLDTQEKQWTEKHRWQMLATPIKFSITPLLKLIAWPFKLLINIIKFFTNYLPFILTLAFLSIATELFAKLIDIVFNQSGLTRLLLIPIIPGLLIALTTAIIAGLYKVAIEFVTSPIQTAQIYYQNFFEAINTLTKNTTIATMLSTFVVAQLLIVSILAWTFILPLAVGALFTAFPALLQAASALTQLPVISQVWSVILSITQTLSVTPFFTWILSTLHIPASYLGLQFSTAALTMAATFTAIVTPFIFAGNWITNTLSDIWATEGWNLQKGPLTALANRLPSLKTGNQYLPLQEEQQNFGQAQTSDQGFMASASTASAPTSKASRIVEETSAHKFSTAEGSLDALTQTSCRAEKLQDLGTSGPNTANLKGSSSEEEIPLENTSIYPSLNDFK